MTPPQTAAQALARYQTDAVTTASPMRLVLMLYERLLRDLHLADEALAQRQIEVANQQLQHAQEIVIELRASLDTEGWDAGEGLARLYDFLHDELVAANVSKSRERVASCRALVEPLLEAWREIAGGLGA